MAGMPSALARRASPRRCRGRCPQALAPWLPSRPFGVYLHVPFCRVRCGYCDFNTYTLTELGADGASVATYADAALRELRPRRAVLGRDAPAVSRRCSSAAAPRPCWPPHDLVRMLDGIRERVRPGAGAEVTTEANPDSVTPESLRRAGRRRLHPRLASACSRRCRHVLATLERTHDPANVRRAVDAARAAGLDRSAST